MLAHELQRVVVGRRHPEHQTLQTVHFVHVVRHLCDTEQEARQAPAAASEPSLISHRLHEQLLPNLVGSCSHEPSTSLKGGHTLNVYVW